MNPDDTGLPIDERRRVGTAERPDIEELKTLDDRTMSDEAVIEGAEAAQAGDLHPNDEAMRILDSFGE